MKAILRYLNKHVKESSAKAVVALKALKNIGKIEDALETIFRLAFDQSQKTEVRVAAIEALKEKAGDDRVTRKTMEILKTQREETEIRIAAYKIAIEGADESVVREILEVLRKEENKQGEEKVTFSTFLTFPVSVSSWLVHHFPLDQPPKVIRSPTTIRPTNPERGTNPN